MKWEKVKLGELCKYITSGGTPKSTVASYYEPKEIPWLKTKEVNYNRLRDTETYISKIGLENSSAKLIPVDSVIVAMYGQGDTAGRVAINKIPLSTNQACCNLVIDKDIANYEFVYYSLSNMYEELVLLKNGGAQPNLNKQKISDFQISLPPLETQNRIASILSAYDDLIENNQKQIKLLEEAAQRLYKEWFVDLHFPGHEDVKIVDGVPEGWKKGHINELIAYDIGGGWGEESSSSECQVPAFVIRGTDFDSLAKGDMENIPFRYHKESNYFKRKLEEGDIVFEVSGGSKNEGVARTMFVTKSLLNGLKNSVICASFCKLVRPKKGFSKYLYDSFRYMRSCHITEQYDKRSASSIVNFRWQEFLVQEMVLIPSHNVLNQYNDLSLNINKIIERKVKTCNLAKEARDRLLPKLMSGEIEV